MPRLVLVDAGVRLKQAWQIRQYPYFCWPYLERIKVWGMAFAIEFRGCCLLLSGVKKTQKKITYCTLD